MDLRRDALLAQLLNGFAEASALFLVAAGLSLIFGVTRIVNVAHGSFFMYGLYLAVFFSTAMPGPLGFWGGILLAAVLVAALGALIEVTILKRLYQAPELFQLLSTFAVLLVLNDLALAVWGAEDILGPRAPGLEGAVPILGRLYPVYDLFLIAVGPVVLAALWYGLRATRFGRLVRAATQDREMVGALGVNQAVLFTAVFALGAFIAGLGGALQVPRQPAALTLDLDVIADAFVITVIGGMGSIPGAFVAAVLIAQVKAVCIWIGTVALLGVTVNVSKFTLVAEFAVMAVVLIVRPYGLFGRKPSEVRAPGEVEPPIRASGVATRLAGVALLGLLVALPALSADSPYRVVLATDILVMVLFATSLHFIVGPGGMHSFGHAAYFGLGAYATAMIVTMADAPMAVAFVAAPLAAALGAALFGWFAVRLSGVYLAMLTLAFAQIVWSIVFQWEDVTGGSNGLIGVWPSAPFNDRETFYFLALGLTVAAVLLLRTILFPPFGYAMRAGRDSPLKAQSLGIDVMRVHWTGFVIAGALAGVAGALFAYLKGSVSPEAVSIAQSIDGLAMVLMGGIHALSGPIVGATVFVWLEDEVSRVTDYWRALLGAVILLIVLLFPEGIVGTLAGWLSRGRAVLSRAAGRGARRGEAPAE